MKANKKRAEQMYCIAVQAEVQLLGGHTGRINWDIVKDSFILGIGPKVAAAEVVRYQREVKPHLWD